MAEYRIATSALIINKANDVRIEVEPGDYIIKEADGTPSKCSEAELQAELARIDADIVARDIAIAEAEAARLAEEQAAQESQEETPPEEEIPPEGV